MHLLADASEPRMGLHGIERCADVVLGKIGKADNGVREAMRIGGSLQPGDFLDAARRLPIGLDIDRGNDARVLDVGKIFADRIVAPDRVVGSKNARHCRSGQPRLVGFTPDVMMGVDDVEMGHGGGSVGGA
jgi:hypothetical protein